MKFFVTALANMAGIWVAAWLLPSVSFRQGQEWPYTVLYLFLIACVLALVNLTVRPVIRVLAFPLYILTLGLFALVTNGLVFWVAGWLSHIINVPLVIDGWGGAIWGGTVTAIVASIVAGILNSFLPQRNRNNL